MLIVLITIVIAAASLLLNAGTPATSDLKDPKALAAKLVNQCAGVKEGDIVWIYGGPDNIALLDELWLQTRKLGAFPVVSLSSTNTGLRYYDEVPAKYDTQTDQFALKLAQMLDVVIGIDMPYDPVAYGKLPADRQATVSKANAPISQIYYSRPIRQISVGNGIYPNPGVAKEMGVTLDELANDFWSGLGTDYSALTRTGEKLKNILSTGKELQITGANGTNIKMSITQQPIHISDGVVTAEEAKQGGVSAQVWLPAGEVYLTPNVGTAEGTIVVDAQNYYGNQIKGLTMTFKAGKLTGMTAQNDCSLLKARYGAGGDAAGNLSLVDFGINPDLKYKPGSRMCAYMQTGMISVNTGNNSWAGGSISESGFSWTYFLPNMTVKIDGKPIVENGNLTM